MIAAVVLVGLVLAAGLSGRLGMRGALVLAAVAILWLFVNSPMEGPVLVTFGPSRGLTGGDLAGFTALALAAYRGWRVRPRRSVRGGSPPAGPREAPPLSDDRPST